MWNLICQGTQSTVYRPTASSGTVTDPTKAYDVDTYPWSTSSTQTNTGSAVAGTTDNLSVSFTTFPTLAKTAFSTAILQIVVSATVTPYNGISLGYIITSGLTTEYSTDGGSTWTQLFQAGNALKLSAPPYDRIQYPPPAVDIASTGYLDANAVTLSKSSFGVTIPSTAFSVGLQNLQVRFTTSTLKSTRAGNQQSSVELS